LHLTWATEQKIATMIFCDYFIIHALLIILAVPQEVFLPMSRHEERGLEFLGREANSPLEKGKGGIYSEPSWLCYARDVKTIFWLGLGWHP
jgi:hypothetical protein